MCNCLSCKQNPPTIDESVASGVLSWDECFTKIARIIARRSKDPRTKAGAVIVSSNNVVFGMGYNGFPRGTTNTDFPWECEGDFLSSKYAYVVHAEANAIFNTTMSAKDCKIYCTLFPCNECAKAIIQVGIKEVIFECDKYHDKDFSVASRKLFDKAGVKYRQYSLSTP